MFKSRDEYWGFRINGCAQRFIQDEGHAQATNDIVIDSLGLNHIAALRTAPQFQKKPGHSDPGKSNREVHALPRGGPGMCGLSCLQSGPWQRCLP
ncbi:hypothetical protein [Tateyamaria omphalii]|uniref:hypothetical protein n=1 Tax=Tateyamaria omphalii TaxID=299262 RepID=UPI00167A9A81|nr:hypothetical protein [Tateyamaria omphalii]